ncbi:hypothetical protein [Methanobrevibacter sp.]|uniref:hypothetical protein n=1 Tax=Methanobrevibacter sp. TaxID=66852 RepID=UPI00386EF6DC
MAKKIGNKINDRVQKGLAYDSINDLNDFLDINVKVVKTLPSEYIDIAQLLNIDYAGLTDDGNILLLEFHTGTPNLGLSRKMFNYSTRLHKEDWRLIRPVAICTDEFPNQEISYGWGLKNVFSYDVVSLKGINGEQKLNNIASKIKNNYALTGEDIITLKLILYTKFNIPPHKIMLQAARLTNTIESLNQKQINDIKAFQKLTAEKFIDKDNFALIKEAIKMRNDMFEEDFKKAFDDGVIKGEKEGRKEGKKDLIRKLSGMLSVSQLAEASGFDEDSINEILNEKNTSPSN